MGKVLLLLSLLALLFVGIGTAIVPNNPMLWLASGAHVYQYARIALVVVLAIQFTTHPPRHLWLRLLAGVVALVIGGWAVKQTYDYHMQFSDTMSFVGASLAIFITALERKAPTFITTIPKAATSVHLA